MKRLIAVALSTSLALCLGCGSEDDGAQNGDVAKFDSSYRKYLEAVCSCDSARNGASAEVCVEARLAETGLSECKRKALSRPDAARAVDCVSEAFLIEADCVEEDACNVEHRNECLDESTENTSGCELPESVQHELAACAPEPFHCVGGGSVDMDAVCDLVEDCADGSDEVPC